MSYPFDLSKPKNGEYGLEGMISAKGDVYSYGVLLMETFTRKKPTNEMFTGEISLRDWVRESLPRALSDVVDANLGASTKDAAEKLKKIRVKFLDDAAASS
ncbi:hypothetical protein CICLE_v10023624mg [Citrus x clementina]|uniref:Serine-threonine/tyrosine-protein kinase catalytic domain-containing protein n=2 Tax=Citrus TaxID=2706 RepID=V4T6C6_CITCL|nr:hypothetical protein CICLE_v10023624mg [Citrus x clementina]GAY68519.1 hypothetical protein CUMW_264770 [Citrus unshiu]